MSADAVPAEGDQLRETNTVVYQILAPGHIVYLPAIRELAITHGEARLAWATGPMMVCALGRIGSDLTEFAKKDERLQRDGAKHLVLKRL